MRCFDHSWSSITEKSSDTWKAVKTYIKQIYKTFLKERDQHNNFLVDFLHDPENFIRSQGKAILNISNYKHVITYLACVVGYQAGPNEDITIENLTVFCTERMNFVLRQMFDFEVNYFMQVFFPDIFVLLPEIPNNNKISSLKYVGRREENGKFSQKVSYTSIENVLLGKNYEGTIGSNIESIFGTFYFNADECTSLIGLFRYCRIETRYHENMLSTFLIKYAQQVHFTSYYFEMMHNQRVQAHTIFLPFGKDFDIGKQTINEKLYQLGINDVLGVSSSYIKDISQTEIEIIIPQPIAIHNGTQGNDVNFREEAFLFFELHARDEKQTALFGMSFKPRSFYLLRSNVVKAEYFGNALRACTARLIELGFTRIYELDNRIPTLVPIYLTSFIGRKDDIHRI